MRQTKKIIIKEENFSKDEDLKNIILEYLIKSLKIEDDIFLEKNNINLNIIMERMEDNV